MSYTRPRKYYYIREKNTQTHILFQKEYGNKLSQAFVY
jgi:hypothetical protein